METRRLPSTHLVGNHNACTRAVYSGGDQALLGHAVAVDEQLHLALGGGHPPQAQGRDVHSGGEGDGDGLGGNAVVQLTREALACTGNIRGSRKPSPEHTLHTDRATIYNVHAHNDNTALYYAVKYDGVNVEGMWGGYCSTTVPDMQTHEVVKDLKPPVRTPSQPRT